MAVMESKVMFDVPSGLLVGWNGFSLVPPDPGALDIPVVEVLPNNPPEGADGADPNKPPDGAGEGAPKTFVVGAPKPVLVLPNPIGAGAGELPPNKPPPVAGAAPNADVVVDDPKAGVALEDEPKTPPPPNAVFVC
jgi:hypothetical protein